MGLLLDQDETHSMFDKYRPEVGDRVSVPGWTEEQVRWGNSTPYMLITDREYTIDYVEVHSSHTKVGIKGVDESFRFNLSTLHWWSHDTRTSPRDSVYTLYKR